MTYPAAIVIAAALFAGAIVVSSQGSADTDDGVALGVIDGSTVWVGRDSGAIRVCRALVPSMVERKWGRVVNIASDAGRVGSSNEAIYSGAKGGLIAFTKTLARELARHGITANAVCPGPTATPLLDAIVKRTPSGQKTIESMVRGVPMRRLGQPADIAPAVVFFASEESAYITGQTLSVSGGLTMV